MHALHPLTTMLYFQLVIMAGTVMLAYYFEYTDTFNVHVQGFFCYDSAYTKPYLGPEETSAIPPAVLYAVVAGVPTLVVSFCRWRMRVVNGGVGTGGECGPRLGVEDRNFYVIGSPCEVLLGKMTRISKTTGLIIVINYGMISGTFYLISITPVFHCVEYIL